MAAGDLENIRPSHPSEAYNSSRTTNIIYREPGENGAVHNIKEVWLSNAQGVAQLIWRIQTGDKTLLAGSQDVAIEYVPTSDITVTTVSIFTDEISAQTACYFRIIEESGIVVAETNTSTVTTDVTLYELAGEKRTATIDPVTLYAGKKYYIYFCEQGYSDAFKPAYFQNTAGNYKAFTELSLINNTVDMTDFGDYLGVCSGQQGMIDFFNSNENDYMYWRTGGGSDYSIFTNQRVFVRSSAACDCNFVGVYDTYATETLDSIMKLEPKNLFLYVGDDWAEQGLTQNSFYVKTNDIPASSYSGLYENLLDPITCGSGIYFTYCYKLYTNNYDVSGIHSFVQTSEINKLAELLMTFGNDMSSYIAINDALYWGHANAIFQRKLEGNIKIEDASSPLSSAYTSESLQLNDGDILFVNSNFTYDGVTAASNPSIVQYSASSFSVINGEWEQKLSTIFNIVENADVYTSTSLSNTISAVDSLQSIKQTIVPDVMFAEAGLSTDKKFYLEINGTEV